MEKFAKILYKFRFLWLVLISIITIFLTFSIKIETDNSLRVWFSANDPEYIAYENYLDIFGGGSFLIVTLRSENTFSLDVLSYIKQKTEELEYLDQVECVHSLANANKIIGIQESIEVQPLLSKIEFVHLQRLRKYALEDELFRGYLISSDGKFSAIVIVFKDMPSEEADRAVSQVEEIVYNGIPINTSVFISGDMKMLFELNRIQKQSQKIIPILGISIICICIFILFRSLYRNLIILLVIGISLCWALGFYSTLCYTINVITGMIIPLVLVLSIADCVHIIKYFDEIRKDYYKKDYSKKDVFIRTVKYITIPCFNTSITTAFGLLSLSISRIDAVKHFGISSAAGIMFAFIISIIVVPSLLILLPANQKVESFRGWGRLLSNISNFNEKRVKYVLVTVLLIFIVSILGITKVKIETNRLECFPKKSDFYQSTKIIDKHLFGIDDIEIVLKGEEDVLKRPAILKTIERLSLEIERLPHVKKVISLTDYVKRIHRALNEDNHEFYKIPDDQFLIAQELFVFSLSDDGRKELESFVTPDYSQGRISIKAEAMPSEKSLILGSLIEKMAKENFLGTGLQITLTGTIYLYNLIQKYLIESQIKGFTLAFITIIGFLYLAFRSVKYWGLSILPNLLPIIIILGIMGWAGITLNISTVMVASVAFGIVVDDTVHFITRFRKEYKPGDIPIQDVLRSTLVSTGQAIIFTSMINITGFLILLISGFQPIREFGILISLALLFALVGDIIVLPANIIACRKMFLRK